MDEGGQPQEGVRCWISGFEEFVDGSWSVVHRSGMPEVHFTDGAGRFAIPCELGMRYDVDFDDEGHRPVFLLAIDPGTTQRVVMGKGRTVAGQVSQRDKDELSSAPWALVTVRRSNPRGLWFQRTVTSDADGRFEYRELLPAEPDGAEWSIGCGGAWLPLDLDANEGHDRIQIEVSITAGTNPIPPRDAHLKPPVLRQLHCVSPGTGEPATRLSLGLVVLADCRPSP